MYKTGVIKVKTQILQTIFAELPQTAKKAKLSIKFDDQEKLNTFKRLEAERQEDEEQCQGIGTQSQSDSDDDFDQGSKSEKENPSQKDKQGMKKQIVEKLRYQKMEINLEEGIIYKQFYEKEFEKIGDTYQVKIKIRAQKITFEGYDIDDIEEAMDQIKNLKDHIEVQYIPKYGLQMSESEMIRNTFDKIGVKIFRILDKYYRWYQICPKLGHEQQRDRRNLIRNTVKRIDGMNHCLQYLNSIQKDVDQFKGSIMNDFQKLRQKYMHYRPLLEDLKGKMFDKEFKEKVNEESTEDELVELSLTKQALVFHSSVSQLMEVSIKDAKALYSQYDYFFITLDSNHPVQQAISFLKSYQYDSLMEKSKVKTKTNEIEEVKDINFIHFVTNYEKVKKTIETKVNDPTFYSDNAPKESVIFCIGFRRKNQEKKMEYLCQILEKLQNLWDRASYKISILLDQAQQIQNSSFSYEFDSVQKVFSLTASQPCLETNLFILREYVIRKKLELKRNHEVAMENEDSNITLSTVNASQMINETSYLNQDVNTSGVLEAIGNVTFPVEGLNEELKEQQDQKSLKLLVDYKVFLPETNKEYNEKYKEASLKENTIMKIDKRNRGLEEDLTKIIGNNFQVFKIQLNPKHKIESYYQDPLKDEIITVFVSAKVSPFIKPKQIGLKIEQGMNDHFPVRLLGLSKQPISENGYLLNTRKKNIEVVGKGFKIKYGQQFEVAKEISYLKK